jgi:autophagy-related protein 16
MADAKAAMAAIGRVTRKLRRRDAVEVDAHRPAIEALNRPFAAQVNHQSP